MEDPSLKTLRNFVLGRDYLNSRWTDQLHQEEQAPHVIYLAVRPEMQHHGLAALLMEEVIGWADSATGLMISLETHNPGNVPLYEHFRLQGVRGAGEAFWT